MRTTTTARSAGVAQVWARAVIEPAARRAFAAWIGCGIAGAVIFGPTGMHPSDATALALGNPAAGAVLAGVWILVFLPTARAIARADQVRYLRSLPGPRLRLAAIGAAALVGLQAPWLALWILGDGARGAAIGLAPTPLLVGLGLLRMPAPRAGSPRWRSGAAAIRAIHLRALRRRAGDALVRGAGLALLAGAAAGLLVTNNEFAGSGAGLLAASVLAVALVPAQVGALLVSVDAHRESAWLCAATGVSPAVRAAGLAFGIAIVHVTAALLASVAALLVAGWQPWIPLCALAVALGTGLLEARAALSAAASPTAAIRAVTGAILAAALAVAWLALTSEIGLVGIVASGLAALASAKETT